MKQTIETLKRDFGTFAKAKSYFNSKARGWSQLCDEVNGVVAQKPYEKMTKKELIAALKQKDEQLAKVETATATATATDKPVITLNQSSDLDILLTKLVYERGVGYEEVFESKEALEGEPERTDDCDWKYFLSVLKRRYYKLSMKYHPDHGGTAEQMDNLNHCYKLALSVVEANEGMKF